jgi:hypothetical protein
MQTIFITAHEIESKHSYISSSILVHGFYSNNYLLIQLLQSLFLSALLFSFSNALILTMRKINNTIHMREISRVFPPTAVSYQIENKIYSYFTFNTLNAFNRQMRATAHDLCYNLQTIKEKYIFQILH